MTYELLPSQIEYFQGTVLGDSRIYTQSVMLIFDGHREMKDIQRAINDLEKLNDVFALRFDRNGTQHFLDYEKEKYVDNIYEAHFFDDEDGLLSYGKNDVDRKIDIFNKPFNVSVVVCPTKFAIVLTGHHLSVMAFRWYS